MSLNMTNGDAMIADFERSKREMTPSPGIVGQHADLVIIDDPVAPESEVSHDLTPWFERPEWQ